MKLLATAFLLAGISCAQLAPAMTLSPRGTGQLLEFAYYTVNKQQQTLVMVSNTTAHAKVLQVRFHEAYNGRDVLEFRVFLPAHDAWTGTVFSLQDAGLTGSGAAILVDDKSCTLPDISVVSPKLADGRSYQPFLNY